MDAVACASLTSLKLPHTTVTSAQGVAAGQFKAPENVKENVSDLPAFCRVAMTIAPSSDSDIKSEIWLPLSGWNGKFEEVGNGGWNGYIQYGALAGALRMDTRPPPPIPDTRGQRKLCARSSREADRLQLSRGSRDGHARQGHHRRALRCRAALSYFIGCSGGGRQAFTEAQRFPEDFEGIIAGDPGYDRTAESFQLVSVSQATSRDRGQFYSTEKFAALHQAALDACDALDGIKDGIIGDPRAANSTQRSSSAKARTPELPDRAQVRRRRNSTRQSSIRKPARRFSRHSAWHRIAFSEHRRPAPAAGDGRRPSNTSVFQDAELGLQDTRHRPRLRARQKDRTMASSARRLQDLKHFVGRGGKLIIYHGWADQNIAPFSSINYYQKLIERPRQQQAEDSVRLYMAPGMGHCGGGEGPSVFDTLTPLEQWREHGVAPKRSSPRRWRKEKLSAHDRYARIRK